jgi:hypothetical protein
MPNTGSDKATSVQAVEAIEAVLDDCLDVDYGYESGEEYRYIRHGTAERILEALTAAGYEVHPKGGCARG